MKKPFSMLCGAIALICLLSMFIPIVAPRYSAEFYHPGSESYTRDYVLSGGYYCAREYWSIMRFALSSGYRLVLSAAMGLLLYWATLSFMGENARIVGVIAATVNLAVILYLMSAMMKVVSVCRPFLMAVIVVDALLATVVAWIRLFAGRAKKRYISLPIRR